VTDILKLVGDPNRQRILLMTWDEEKTAGDIAGELPVTFGAASQHLKLLREAGVLDCRKAGRNRYYRANREKLGALGPYLESFWRSRLAALGSSIEADQSAARRKKR
jgi:DNA-binding transcriptional ArsR family regulator